MLTFHPMLAGVSYALELNGTIVARLADVQGSGRKIDALTVEIGMSSSAELLAWLGQFLSGQATRRRGAVLACDKTFHQRARRVFEQAVISAIGFPEFDAGSKEPVYITVTITPESVSYEPNGANQGIEAPGPSVRGIPGPSIPLWKSSFRLRIDRLEEPCRHVRRIEAMTTRPLASGGSMVLAVPPDHADPFRRWCANGRGSADLRRGSLTIGDRLVLTFAGLCIEKCAGPRPGDPLVAISLAWARAALGSS